MKIAIWHNLPSGGGKRALYNHIKALKENGHYVIQCNVRNITERKKIEDALAHHTAELTAAAYNRLS